LRFNYFLQFVIILTFGLGGLGFPIVANLAGFVRYNFLRLVASEPKNKRYRPWLLNLNVLAVLVLAAFAVRQVWLRRQATVAR